MRSQALSATGAAVAFALVVLCTASVAANDGSACFGPDEPVVVSGAAGPASLALDDGRVVRLVDIRPAAGGLSGLKTVQGPATLNRVVATQPDRHGRILGDIVFDATRSATRDRLSAMLLQRGLAFVDPAVMHASCLNGLFRAEAVAEAAARGAWAAAIPVPAEEAARLPTRTGDYAIVEGRVLSVGTTRRTIYLNFGTDHRTDFTALARRGDVRRWEDALTALEGERVRVRGVLEAWNGGLIRIEHPAQVERLGRSAP